MLSQSIAAASALRQELGSSPPSYQQPEDYRREVQQRLNAIEASAVGSAGNLSAGLGAVLRDCFQTPPLEPAAGLAAFTSLDSSRSSSFQQPPSQTTSNVVLAWGLTALAGASTLAGAALVSFATPERMRYIVFLEAFTAGVMLQVQ